MATPETKATPSATQAPRETAEKTETPKAATPKAITPTPKEETVKTTATLKAVKKTAKVKAAKTKTAVKKAVTSKKKGADFKPYKATYTGGRWGWGGKVVEVIGPDSHGTSGAAANYRRVKLGGEEHNVNLSHLQK